MLSNIAFRTMWTCNAVSAQPRRPAIGQQCTKSNRLHVACAFSHNLEPWQQAKLEEAFLTGKRKIKVNELCHTVGLERHVVLSWFKQHEALPESVRLSIHEARIAALEADAARAALLQQAEQDQHAATAPAGNGNAASLPSPAERQKQYYAKKRLGWDVEDTFEKVYAAHRGRPNDEVVRSLCAMFKMPRKRVVEWFAARRQASSQDKRSQAAIRRASASPFEDTKSRPPNDNGAETV